MKKKARVEMMPLIDTMFLLLIFLIYSMLSMVHHKGIDVVLPVSEASVSDTQDYDVLIMNKDKTLFINEDKVSRAELKETLKKKFADPKKAVIYLRIDETLPYKEVIYVMDQLRMVGITQIFFETDPQSDTI